MTKKSNHKSKTTSRSTRETRSFESRKLNNIKEKEIPLKKTNQKSKKTRNRLISEDTTIPAIKESKSIKYEKKFTAEQHDFKLQKNHKIHCNKLINLFEINNQIDFTHSDVILAIIEIALNSDYYCIPYSTKSNHFWEEVVKYDELKRIFKCKSSNNTGC